MALRKRGEKSTEKNRISPVLMSVIYLLVIVCISTPFTLSKYIATANADSMSRIAGFEVTMTDADGSGDQIEFTDFESATPKAYSFVVTNNSDVTTDYTVQIELTTALPSYMSMEVKAGDTAFTTPTPITVNRTITHTADTSGTQKTSTYTAYIYTFDGADALSFGEAEIWTVTLALDADTNTSNVASFRVDVSVTASQVD